MLIHKHVKTAASEALGTTLNFIDIWLKRLEENYNARRVAYITAMKYMFKQISLTTIKVITPKNVSETYDRNWWWTVCGKKCLRTTSIKDINTK